MHVLNLRELCMLIHWAACLLRTIVDLKGNSTSIYFHLWRFSDVGFQDPLLWSHVIILRMAATIDNLLLDLWSKVKRHIMSEECICEDNRKNQYWAKIETFCQQGKYIFLYFSKMVSWLIVLLKACITALFGNPFWKD